MSIFKDIKNKSKDNGITIIAGCGRLGSSIANRLSEDGKDVIIIDSNSESFRKLSPTFGGVEIVGDAAEMFLEHDADIRNAASVIAVTNHDNTNIMIAQMAKEFFHIDKVIARLYDPERECVYRDFGIETICPVVLSTSKVDSMLYGKR
ncbi:MAG: TrkA family potassium uptake protein [Eubacteriales bacterium]|nr:TrkA family potassium uptake protein [Eubacteriales bacterium]